MTSPAPVPRRAGTLGRFGWAMFDWANQPYFTLIGSFIFVPYFKNVFVGDPVRGQALLGDTMAAGAFIVAVVSPVLGAVADQSGRRKPWLAGLSLIYMAGVSALWFAAPGTASGPWPILLAMIVTAVAIEVATVFNNAMLPDIVESHHLGFWSGFGFALGYAGALVALIGLVLAFIGPATPAIAALHLDFLPPAPLWGVDPSAYEHVRIVGPLSALWYAVFVLPMFLFTPDRPGIRVPLGRAAVRGLAELGRTAVQVSRYRNVLNFLLARLLFNDGLAAAYIFGVAYGATVFGWGAMETALFGLIALVLAAVSAVVFGHIDDRLGARRVLFISLGLLIVGVLGAVSVTPDRIFFVIPVAPTDPDKFLSSAGEWLYLGFGALVGMGGGPAQAASRSLMGRIAPPQHMTEFFGFYALSGKVTVFLAPLLVARITEATSSDRWGVSAVLGFLILGFLLLTVVKEEAAGDIAR